MSSEGLWEDRDVRFDINPRFELFSLLYHYKLQEYKIFFLKLCQDNFAAPPTNFSCMQ